MNTFLSIGTKGQINHRLINTWMNAGVIRPNDSFCRLDKILKIRPSRLESDLYLAKVCACYSAEEKNYPSYNTAKLMIKSQNTPIWDLYPELLKIQVVDSDKRCLWVNPDIALNYVLGTRLGRRIRRWSKEGYDISYKTYIPHRGIRDESNNYDKKDIRRFFNVETNLIITPDFRVLHFCDDGNYWNFIVVLEQLLIGFPELLIKESITKGEVEIGKYQNLEFFAKRNYSSLLKLLLLTKTLENKKGSPTLISSLKDLSSFIDRSGLIVSVRRASNPYDAVTKILENFNGL